KIFCISSETKLQSLLEPRDLQEVSYLPTKSFDQMIKVPSKGSLSPQVLELIPSLSWVSKFSLSELYQLSKVSKKIIPSRALRCRDLPIFQIFCSPDRKS